MNDKASGARDWFVRNWERALFALAGLVLLGDSLRLVYFEKITEAAAVFGIGFLCFIYANVARFKRFKGLGFEAELWEDKQREAADLIERLREVVSIYTREVVIGNVRAGRWGGGPGWADHWKLYDDLVTQHNVLGQKIDFSGIKKVMDDYFLFDMSLRYVEKVNAAINDGQRLAHAKIGSEFGSPVRDLEGFNKRTEEHRKIPEPINDPFQISTQADLAGHALKRWDEARTYLKQHFDVDPDLNTDVLERLARVSKLYQSRPVLVTKELVGWASGNS